MRNTSLGLSSLSLLALVATSSQAATTLGRAFSFGFTNGNLVRNWSFESRGDNWVDDGQTWSRYRASQAGISAISGSYVACFSGTNNTGGTIKKLSSEFIPVEPGTQYQLSFYVNTTAGFTGAHPSVSFFSDKAGTVAGSDFPGTNYTSGVTWTLKTYSFITPAGTNFAQITLAEIANLMGGEAYFDDVVLETGVSTATSRDSIQETVAFMNDMGKPLQMQQKISGGGNNTRRYMVSTDSVDYQLRSLRNYLPYGRNGTPNYDPGFDANSMAFNNGNNGKGSLGTVPYSRTEYSDSLMRGDTAGYMAGQPWSTVDKRIKSGSYYTASLTAPTNPDVISIDDVERDYLLSWSRDVDGRYSLAWANSLGQTVQTAVKPASTWLYTRYEYFPNGQLKKTLQNSDVPGNVDQQDFREVTNFNSAGQATSTYSKDRGLRKFWYNRLGQLRLTRHESQAANEYDYTNYDENDRPIAFGVETIIPLSPAAVEARSFNGTSITEHKGVIYDTLGNFQSRTGLLLSDLMPGKTLGLNGQGRVVCEYNYNKGVNIAGMDAKSKFVATFYNYNAYGEVVESYKYIGPVKDAARRIHSVSYFYDVNHRLYQTIMSDNGSPAYTTYQKYVFDGLGRVAQVNGYGTKVYAKYQYYEWGGVKSVTLGSASTSTGTRIDFNYNPQGWVKEIKATQQSTGAVEFQQFLGYEDKAYVDPVMPVVVPKFDGSIVQQLVKFADDVNAVNPIRVTNYSYDNLNRVLVADARKNTGTSPPWDANKQILFANLSLTDSDDLDSRLTYDDIGRITTNQNGVSTANQASYAYQGNSYRLDHVTGKTSQTGTRDASPAGTFVYDARGRMTEDKSKKLLINYGWDDMPVEFGLDSGDTLSSSFNFYDAQGQRVSRVCVKTEYRVWVPITATDVTILIKGFKDVSAITPIVTASITDVGLLADGDRRHVEIYDAAGAIVSTSDRKGIFGISGQIGEITPTDSYRYFVKNHQGSIMRSVGENGQYAGDDPEGNAIDYLAYGSQSQLKSGGTSEARTFTGKELELATGLYAFGARWYDPELALFMSPDAAGQYFNPFSYGSGNPINGTDPDGNWFWFDDAVAIVAGAVAGYVSYGVASGDWCSWTALGMAGVGAAAGEGALYTGGATLTALGGVGVTGAGAAVVAGAAGGAVGGAISGIGGYSVGAAAGDHSWDVGDAAKATGLGVASGALGGALGGAAAVGAGALAGQLGAQSPVLAGTVGGAAGGYVGGAGVTLAMGGSLAEANRQGLLGMAQGAAAGAVTAYAYSKVNSIDPWTGKGVETPQIPIRDPNSTNAIQPDLTINNQSPEIVLSDRGASQSIRQYTMSGGNTEALRQFNSLPLSNVHPVVRGGYVGQMPNGAYVTYYPSSASGGNPTIVMQGMGKTVKVRFVP